MEAQRPNVKVLVVDDSAFMRKLIADMLSQESGIEVVGTARNGKECLEKAQCLHPDVITLDIEMPVMNGLATLSNLINIKPTPKVIMLSSLTHEGAVETIKALELGAFDFIAKPTDALKKLSLDGIGDELRSKVFDAVKSNFVAKGVVNPFYKTDSQSIATNFNKRNEKLKYIIAIGTSTGGPRALQDVVPLFPRNIPAAVLIVQHMPPGFTKSLAGRLDNLSQITVKEAAEGDILKPGHAYIAPGDFHMVLSKALNNEYKISINTNPPVTGHRPSVNVMMESVARSGHKDIIAVMMTGMGSDGSDGILKIKQAGGKTIAQNEETCVVYGMPKAAVNIGAIDKSVPLQDIAKEVLKYMGV